MACFQLLAGQLFAQDCVQSEDVLRYVDPFIGTGGAGFAQGNAFVGAAVPFGMAKPGPDTSGRLGKAGFAHTSGYWYLDRYIDGFSQIHLHGTGVADYGNILLMPSTGMTRKKTSERHWRLRFSHEQEKAEPGYYAVRLRPENIYAELTATDRATVHRYTFPEGKEATVILDVTHTLGNGKSLDAAVSIFPQKQMVEGYTLSAGDFVGEKGAFYVYFSAEFNQPFTSYGTFQDGKLFPGERNRKDRRRGARLGAYFSFGKIAKEVTVRIGISFVGIEQARENREKELSRKSFEQIRQEALSRWKNLLSRVIVCGGTKKQRTIFYTALYHAFLMPTLFTNRDGTYIGLDKKVHRAEHFTYYTDFSLWDTYRTVHSLYILLTPQKAREMVLSLLQMAKQYGYLPRWPLAAHETASMVGNPASIVITESFLKGIPFNVQEAYELMKEQALRGLGRPSACLAYGYCPADLVGGSVSQTLEFAYADFAIALLAAALDKKEDFALFLERSRAYQKLWDEEKAFFRPRTASGKWAEDPFQPDLPLQKHYVEGNAWQYLFFVPWDVRGLIELFGSREKFLRKLNQFFEQSKKHAAKKIGKGKLAITLPDPYYWHGNEPDIHVPYMYALAGEYRKAPRWIRWVMEEKYDATPDGLNGNDDAGTLSSWYVFSALGLYPLAGTDIYLVGSPIFEKVVLKLQEDQLVIEAPGASSRKIFVQQAQLNGKPLTTPWFAHRQMAKGGTLFLKMGSQPTAWGRTEPIDPLSEERGREKAH